MNASPQDRATFRASYIETALWSEYIGDDFAAYWLAKHDEDFPPDTSMQSFGFTADDIDGGALALITADCDAFMQENADDLADCDATHAGHDFWLTRNRHGAGFWDGDYPEPIATRLTDASHAFGECSLYVGDDERIHLA